MQEQLQKLYLQTFGEPVLSCAQLKAHASGRSLYRITGSSRTVIGAHNGDIAENRAFIEFSKHFRAYGLPVPEVFATSADQCFYLEQDLGDTTLFDLLQSARTEADPFPQKIEILYHKAVEKLSFFQIEAGQTLDYGHCHQTARYDQAAMWADLRFFEIEFLERIVPGHAGTLDSEVGNLIQELSTVPADYFLYRDFQSRNIMVLNDELAFIDYQAGRRGPLQYDVASLLFQAQARIPQAARDRILDFYMQCIQSRVAISPDQFKEHFYGFVIIRLIQVLGAYGRAGLEGGKEYFLKGIPQVIALTLEILEGGRSGKRYTKLVQLLDSIPRAI